MEEYYDHIREYLPIYFQTKDNEEYIEYLKNAYLTNLNGEAYQFSLIAYHMLYMSFIYKTIWTMKASDVDGISDAINAQKRTLGGDLFSPFQLSLLGEKHTISYLSLLKIHQNAIEGYQLPIRHRDHCAHASGEIHYNFDSVERFICQDLEYVNSIHAKSREAVIALFEEYLEENWNPENREYFLAEDSLISIIKEQLFSVKDIEVLLSIDWQAKLGLSDSSETIHKKIMILVLMGIGVENGLEIETSEFHNIAEQLFSGFEDTSEFKVADIGIIINDELHKIKSDEHNPFHSEVLMLQEKFLKIIND